MLTTVMKENSITSFVREGQIIVYSNDAYEKTGQLLKEKRRIGDIQLR